MAVPSNVRRVATETHYGWAVRYCSLHACQCVGVVDVGSGGGGVVGAAGAGAEDGVLGGVDVCVMGRKRLFLVLLFHWRSTKTGGVVAFFVIAGSLTSVSGVFPGVFLVLIIVFVLNIFLLL